MQGHVTSSYYSAILKKSIAMALVKDGLSKEGQILYAPLSNGKIIKSGTSELALELEKKGYKKLN